MKLYRSNTNYFGYGWWIKLFEKSGLSIDIYTKLITIGFNIEIAWNEDNKWIHICLPQVSITYFHQPDWY